ncbi:helix-turn-helix domain-containing protein [Nocardiopsis baichengensis]|uniref:helix-turn-helix domain-containing protein n=1 Tax=Nocardiopsis baichengensis TaxID=280240 RepID=UPI0003750EE0|nr:helix-turn-helix domain-containing protein [Nocardiopsis baichengensis]
MLEQPLFGRRLRELRKRRGLSQAELAGEEISTGYLSRLESGARRPTEKVAAHLAERLGVAPADFGRPSGGSSLAKAVGIAGSSEDGEADDALVTALEQADDADPLLRWQALWMVADRWWRQGAHAKERSCAAELVALADELDLPELQCRSSTRLARCLRSTGDMAGAIGEAEKACRLAREQRLSVQDTGKALLVLVSAEAEAGRLPEARAHADELVDLAEAPGRLRAKALWSAATVRFRMGEQTAALERLERAMKGLDSHDDLKLWVQLRLAAASFCVQIEPPLADRARPYLEEVRVPIELMGGPVLRQEWLMLHAHLAFLEGRYEDARAARDEVRAGEMLLAYRDEVRLAVLEARLMVLEGRVEEGIRRLKELGEQTQGAANLDLAAEVWRVLAQVLESVRSAPSPERLEG